MVKKGDPLIKFDNQAIQDKGFDTTVMVIVTNTNNYLDIINSHENEVVTSGQDVSALMI